jgi:signal transduction histidine kinase
MESFRPVTAEIDETKLSLAISNLVENAVKYNHDNGWVHVSLNADHKFFYVKVEDSGIGIPKEDQAHVFERFFRVDKSHSREIGGSFRSKIRISRRNGYISFIRTMMFLNCI